MPQLDGLLFPRGLDLRERTQLFLDSRLPDAHRDRVRSAGYKVLRRLEQAGLVAAHRYANLPRVYALTAAGHRFLRDNGLARLPDYRAGVADSLVQHELLVNGIGLVLRELLGLTVSTEFERYLLSRGVQSVSWEEIPLPDLWVSHPDGPKAVEIERTQKSAKRYEKIWDCYRRDLPPRAVVLYVAAFPNGARLLLSRARNLLADFVYVCNLEDFASSSGRCDFIGYRGSRVALGAGECHPQDLIERGQAASLSARPGSTGSRERLAASPSAPPAQRFRAGPLTLPASREGQSVAPLLKGSPRPLPPAPSPTPEGGDLTGESR